MECNLSTNTPEETRPMDEDLLAAKDPSADLKHSDPNSDALLDTGNPMAPSDVGEQDKNNETPSVCVKVKTVTNPETLRSDPPENGMDVDTRIVEVNSTSGSDMVVVPPTATLVSLLNVGQQETVKPDASNVYHVTLDDAGKILLTAGLSDVQVVVKTEGEKVPLTDTEPQESSGSGPADNPVITTTEEGSTENNTGQERLSPGIEKTFCCDLCSARFTRYGNYTRHRMIHTISSQDDFRYKCDVCDRMFLQRCDLKRHKLIHEGIQPFKCNTCGRGYIRKSDFVVHMRFHNNDRSFTCSECPKAFVQSGDLKRHQRLVHQKKPSLQCGHCQRKYSSETTLIRHMQVSHRDIIINTLDTQGTQLTGVNTEEETHVVHTNDEKQLCTEEK